MLTYNITLVLGEKSPSVKLKEYISQEKLLDLTGRKSQKRRILGAVKSRLAVRQEGPGKIWGASSLPSTPETTSKQPLTIFTTVL